MNKEPEAIKNLLAWLLQDPTPTATTPSGLGSPVGTSREEDLLPADLQFDESDPLDSEEMGDLGANLSESNHFYFEETSFEPGDIPAVQDRFHSLLKRRLRTEIERKPPLFPWESELCDYESEAASFLPTTLWVTQLTNIDLPVPMPDEILSRLFEQCQKVVQSSLREGAKLVQAVEELFPGHDQTLNQLAGYVLAAPARSGATGGRSPIANSNFPARYEAATQPQQMALSLLAAREILDSLTLSVSSQQPMAQRQWLTAQGQLTLTAEYPQGRQLLRIQGQLPCPGSFQLKGGDAQASAQRSTSGVLSVELFDPSPNQIYPLEVRLTNSESPLVFAVHPTTSEI